MARLEENKNPEFDAVTVIVGNAAYYNEDIKSVYSKTKVGLYLRLSAQWNFKNELLKSCTGLRASENGGPEPNSFIQTVGCYGMLT